MRFLSAASALFLLLISAFSFAAEPDAAETKRLHDLFDAEWEWGLREYPTWASHLGDLRYNTKWTDDSLAGYERRHAHRVELLGKLQTFDREKLSRADQINLELFRQEVQSDVDTYPFGSYLIPLTARDGIQDASSTADSLQFKSAKDFEDWIARMEAIPTSVAQNMELMREGIKRGVLHPRIVMQRVPAQIARQVVDVPEDSLFYKPFLSMPTEVSEADQARLRETAKNVIAEQVVPAYREFQTFFNEEYLPACYENVGVWQIPNGQDYYALRVRQFTTTELTPQEVHEIGLKEVKRIRSEMERVMAAAKFEGTFDEFLEFLRTDPQFYCETPQQLMDEYQAVCRRIDPLLPQLFAKLPRIPYDLQAIPDHLAPDTTTAYYRQPAADGTRPGSYFVNLYKPEVRPRYEMMALSMHEAVPGHHLQIALAMELENLPEFRRYGGYTAFIEGWALYAESLGDELGLYDDPYSKFGQLTYEMWRAVRLVVDTGMHSLKWTRQEAIDFFAANTAKTQHDIENEIDRYIAWPGQALAYKIGELKIKELRKRAESHLGDKFDLKEFHNVVLSSGAIPLSVLEENVERWMAERK